MNICLITYLDFDNETHFAPGKGTMDMFSFVLFSKMQLKDDKRYL